MTKAAAEMISRIKDMSPAELDAERRRIIQAANGNPRDIPDDDLHLLAFIAGALRRGAAGPPKEARVASPKGKKMKLTLAELGEILND